MYSGRFTDSLHRKSGGNILHQNGFKNKTILFKMHGFNIFCVKQNLSKLDAAQVVSCIFKKPYACHFQDTFLPVIPSFL
jgi:hypothetical protein